VLSGERVEESPRAIHAHQHTSEYPLLHVCFAVLVDPRDRSVERESLEGYRKNPFHLCFGFGS
jgi:hypothetical protein